MSCHRIHRFEAKQAEVHQQLAGLQQEHSAFKHQYDSLLEQLDQQHSLIQQLSASSGEELCREDSGETESGGEWKPK